MRSHPFGNVHHMQLEISPGYTELFVPLKTEEFHSDVHPMAPNPLPTPPQESLTRVQQLFNLASQCHKDGKTLKTSHLDIMSDVSMVFFSSISFHIQKQVRNSRRCCSEAFAQTLSLVLFRNIHFGQVVAYQQGVKKKYIYIYTILVDVFICRHGPLLVCINRPKFPTDK